MLRASPDVRGVSRAFIDRAGEVPQLQIEIDRGRAARYGLNVADVEDVIETALGGKVATEIWEGERRSASSCDCARRIAKDMAASPASWSTRRRAARPAGRRREHFSIGAGSMNISRESGTRLIAIGVFIRGRDMGGIVEEMRGACRNRQVAPGYYVTLGGEFENQQRAMTRLAFIVP